jgi:hypothetical protein
VPPRSTARKHAIVAKDDPVPEIASELAEALRRCADELAGIGGSLAYLAAAKHSGTAGEQRQLAAVIYHTSIQRFGGVKYDGEPIAQKDLDELTKVFRALMRK